MTSQIDQARRYLQGCPPAIDGQGGHATAFSVACEVINGFALSETDAHTVLSEWNAKCQPPWKPHELAHKIQDAMKAPPRLPRGHKLNQKKGMKFTSSRNHTALPALPARAPTTNGNAKPAIKAPKIALSLDILPDEIQDGAREYIRAMFKEGEGIRITPARWDEEANKEVPDGGGICLSREEWLRKLDKFKGNPNGIFSSTRKTGIYIAVNPYAIGKTKDADVTEFRHALVEFDSSSGLSPEFQFELYQKSGIPCTAIVASGGESTHAIVRVDAQSRAEYDERVAKLYGYFQAAGYAVDPANKNPGRLSRLPFCVRGDRRQELLALNCGAESFTEWVAKQELEGIGSRKTLADLMAIDPLDMSNVLLGDDWLNRGAACLIAAPSGIGKSTWEMQAACHWAIGRPFWGIKPTKALRSVIIFAENDDRDNRRAMSSIIERMSIEPGSPEWNAINEHVIFRECYSASGEAFLGIAQRIADAEKPDLMWLDPMASYAGDDIGKQTVIASFCRAGLHPIAKACGFAWMIINHFTKPPSDAKARAGWGSSDHQYRGAGSYDLTGWARAGITISETGEGAFMFRFSKRGKQSGATHPDGQPTTIVWARHAASGVYWEQVDPPAETEPSEGREGKPAPSSGDMVALVPVGDKGIQRGELLLAARAKGFTAAAAAVMLEKLLDANEPSIRSAQVKREGRRSATVIFRT